MSSSDQNPTVPRTPPGDPNATSALTPVAARGAPAGGAPTVPGYEVEGHIATGGMGAVYRARHLRLNRPVALKLILDARAGETDLARFRREAEAMAAARHPHVAEVFDSGEAAGRPFLVMELLPGGTLVARFAAPVPPADAVALMHKVASGVGAAHERGIVHRDLKPSNVLLDAAGEPKVTDFGLAKLGTDANLTHSGAVFGTPAYMAPEQAAGSPFVGPAADVWALGVMLYEALTGRNPFKADSVPATLANVSNRTPPNPRALVAVPADLERIVLKCLEKEPADRYPTARELADDLARFARGEPISVRRPGPAERWFKWARRKPAEAAALVLAAAAVVLVAFAGTATWLWRDATDARDTAETALVGEQKATAALADSLGKEQKAVAALEVALTGEKEARAAEARAVAGERAAQARLRFQQYARNVDLAHREWQAGNVTRARTLLDNCPSEFRNWEWRYVHRLCNSDVLTLVAKTNRPEPSGVQALAFTPNGERLLAVHFDWLVLWDVRTGKQLASRAGPDVGPRGIAFSADTSLVAWAGGLIVSVWDPEANRIVSTFRAPSEVRGVAFAPDGKRYLARTTDRVFVCDTESGNKVVEIAGHTGGTTAAEFTASGRQVVSAGADGAIRVWDAKTGAAVQVLAEKLDYVGPLALSGDGKRVALAHGSPYAVSVWELGSGKRLGTFDRHRAQVARIEFDGEFVGSVDLNGRAYVWIPGSFMVSEVFGTAVNSGSLFNRPRRRLLTADRDGGLRLDAISDPWESVQATLFKSDNDPPRAVATSPDGRFVATGTGGTVRLWDLDRSPSVVRHGRRGETVVAVDYSADGTRELAVGSAGLVVRRTGADVPPLFTVPPPPDWFQEAELSAPGTHVLTGHGAAVKLWKVGTAEPLATFKRPPGANGFAGANARFAPDGARAVVRYVQQPEVDVIDTATGKLAQTIRHPEARIVSAVLTTRNELFTQGPTLLCAWDATTGAEVRRFALPANVGASTLAAHPTAPEAWLLSVGRLTVFEARTGAVRVEPFASGPQSNHFSFSSDGTRFLTGGREVRVFDTATREELLTLSVEDRDGGRGTPRFAGERIVLTRGHNTVVWDARPVNPAFVKK